ncbi:ferritin, lower subunit-like [Heterocephalus glaber]|uniref:Ferritin n=1 Tax=Heterocephalus glaber TaxID=10181 RepID=A0AAX6RDU8_HETGA|nr:ferritin, lower subunit-like [Heterocephalus glaber]
MEYQKHNPFPAECASGINYVAGYQMYIADVYITLACYFTKPTGKPPFAMFFEDMSDIKWDQSKEFLRFLRRREGMVRFPFIRKAKMGYIRTPEEGLTHVLNLEVVLTRIMESLKTSASQAGETYLIQFVEELLIKQEKCKKFLECHISTQKKLEEYSRQRRQSENPAGASEPGEDTSLMAVAYKIF